MGTVLWRTALSTNIKERLDFSCALLDAQGRLVVNAPHIPVHLGALAVCARRSGSLADEARRYGRNKPSGIWRFPLPDVTLVTPVFSEENVLLAMLPAAPTTLKLAARLDQCCRTRRHWPKRGRHGADVLGP